ncbi:MAG TPA: acetamidase/formamidase family protein [Puia sp.]
MRNTLANLFLLPLALQAQQPKHIAFNPTTFSNAFTLNRTPVLTISPGDTVSTETIDAMGYDQKAVKRARGGNPLTGPFFITGAAPGDIIAVHLLNVSLNRDYAKTTDYFASRSMPKEIMKEFKTAPLVRWKLDLQTNQGWPDSSVYDYPHLKNFKVPLSPFLGCIGVAPANRKNEILSFFQGPFGGNIDFNRARSGSTVYLPVFHEGAYLYIGDGHALQGDGEIAANALETSMNVTFSVQLIKNDTLQFPRVEDDEYLMALGIEKETPDAIRLASKNLLDWLQKDYHLTLHEATQVMSTTIEYGIAEIADPYVTIAAKIKKTRLRSLKN